MVGVGRGHAAQALAAVDDRQDAVAHDEHLGAGHGADRVVGEPHGALDPVDRHRERPPLDLDEHRGHDRERQRQADLRGRALAELGREEHLAAQLADGRADRVHADAAAGDVRRDLGGGEAGVEEQLGGGLGVDRVDRVGGDHAALGGLAGHPGGVDARAVVAHGDDHVAAGVAGGDLERARGGLAGRDRAPPPTPGRGRARCGRGARADRRARRPRCGRARSACRPA